MAPEVTAHAGGSKPANGPPKSLIEHINHLKLLLEHLPESHALPLDPVESKYIFGLDPEILEEDLGGMAALSRCLEVAFDTWNQPDGEIEFSERGRCLAEDLIKFLKEVLRHHLKSEIDHAVFKDAWLERLIWAAIHAGAKVPPRPKRKADVLQSNKNSKSTPTTPILSPDSDSQQSHPLKKPRNDAIVIASSSSDDELPGTFPTQSTSKTASSTSSATSESFEAFGDWRKPVNGTQRTLDAVGWKKWGPGEQDTYLKKEASHAAEERRSWREKEKRAKEAAKERRCALGAAREPTSDVTAVLMHGANAVALSQALPDVAQISRPDKNWCNVRNGTQGGAVVSKATRMNYYHPFLWMHIDKAMHSVDWSPSVAVRLLQRDHPMLFSKLNKGTISKWTQHGKKEWSTKTLQNVQNRMVLEASGHSGILASYDSIREAINMTLKGL
ncbi:hypothetical protein EDD18DRAFT_1354453 [Armillaria luteobubalina]|uniref:Uncharacterized protein n=1 Tax=Armillaria luteobubalina TaxID=153913 RepID=A0AA39USB0_9AGAR|nr:hypothetical protein EDD18DRAFT_1354453 [Armillaria luteobubalina]